MRKARRLVVSAIGALLLGLMLQTALAQNAAYHGNVQSRVFHRPGCQYYDCKNCTAVFQSREAAVAAGFKPCGKCKP